MSSYILTQALLILGGVTVFILGLKFMSESMENLAGKKLKTLLKSCATSRLSGLFTGAIASGAMQSSLAVEIISISFISSNMLTFLEAAPFVLGANIGTTVTAQLLSLSGSKFNVTALGSLIAFIGLILSTTKKPIIKALGEVMIGFGLIFIGLEIMSEGVSAFKGLKWFRAIFLVENPLILFFNGIIITAVLQSSSAVTGVMIVLATNGLMSFPQAVFLILGANVGTCLSPIIASMNKCAEARKLAWFNLCFNLFGGLLFLPFLCAFSKWFTSLFYSFSPSTERAIANFHTLFNVICCLLVLPILRPFAKFIDFIVKDNRKKAEKNTNKQTFAFKQN